MDEEINVGGNLYEELAKWHLELLKTKCAVNSLLGSCEQLKLGCT